MSVLRVWNLRRGDADDDRFGPYAAGLHGLFASVLLELKCERFAPTGT